MSLQKLLFVFLTIAFATNAQQLAKSADQSNQDWVSPTEQKHTLIAEPSTREKTAIVDSDTNKPAMRAQQVLVGGRRPSSGSRRYHSPAQRYYKPLLRALKREDRHELKQVVRSNITKAQIKERVEEWITKAEDSKTKQAFELFKQERELIRQLKLIGEENFLEDKSDEAKTLYFELKKLVEDQSLTWDETCTLRNQSLKKANREIVKELRHKGRPCYRNNSYN